MGAQEWGPYSGIKDNEEGYSPKNTEYSNGGHTQVKRITRRDTPPRIQNTAMGAILR